MDSSENEIVSDPNDHKNSETNPYPSPHNRRFLRFCHMEISTIYESLSNQTVLLFLSRMSMAIMPFMGFSQQFYRHVQYKIDHGADENATDGLMQTAQHLASVRSSVGAADLLLQNGARVEATDLNGYRAVHVAAQYGQITFLNYIVAKYHADFDVPYNDGRSPLHWAAFKEFADTIRPLVFRYASQGRQDKEGCTQQPGAVAFVVIDALIFIAGGTLVTLQISQIVRNVTTNEFSNAIRYLYLRGPDGRFRNPYNYRCRKNCSDFLIRAIQMMMRLLGLPYSR